MAASATVELDTIKALSESALAANPAVEDLRLALYNLRLAEKDSRTKDQLDATLRIGRIYDREQCFSKAVKYFRQAETLAQK